jgi:tetratricopeptide (TPR) repeat protein
VVADQKDFGVRTFGMPDNPGFLGVCFGSVITANSPSTQAAHPANWEAVLWHEFCHVVTLNLTRNKMPRWLSEGISVFEERQMNPSWGQVMNPKYREMVLGDDLKKVSELSAAFLAPPSDLHLQFAYYESCLVVEFLVERYGLEALKKILHDLGEGVEINQALTQNTLPLSVLDRDFTVYARARAEALAPGLDWAKPANRELARADEKFFAERPTNYYALQRHAQKLLSDKKWEEAKEPLFILLTNYPAGTEAYAMLAQAHRGLQETNAERTVLDRLARIDADATDAYLRLAEIAVVHRDWTQAVDSAQRFLAVNPLLPQPYRFLAQAAEAANATDEAIHAYRTLLLLDPPDPAEAHFRLARLLHQTKDPTARRHVLQALEEAPRFREAHRLLLQMAAESNPAAAPAPAPPAAPVKPAAK